MILCRKVLLKRKYIKEHNIHKRKSTLVLIRDNFPKKKLLCSGHDSLRGKILEKTNLWKNTLEGKTLETGNKFEGVK